MKTLIRRKQNLNGGYPLITSTLKRLRPALMAVAALFAFGALTASAEAKDKKPVSVFPAPKTQVASDDTTFSFRGIRPKNMGPIEVRDRDGNRIGGKRLKHSDGKGVSFIPNGKFEPGEKVRVKTKRGIMLAKNGNFWVRIGRFYGDDDEQAAPGTPCLLYTSPSPRD